MRKYFKIAEAEFFIESCCEEIPCSGRELSLFISGPSDSALRCAIALTDNIPLPEGKEVVRMPGMSEYMYNGNLIRYKGPIAESEVNACIRTEFGKDSISILVNKNIYPGITDSVILDAIGAERLLIRNGGVILHSSYIDFGGDAILFTAPSGAGKSTQAELWRKLRGAETINGDRSVIGMREGNAYAYGLPYSGSSGICINRTLPLKAIVYLNKSEEKNSSITLLKGFDAFRHVWEGCCVDTWNREDTSLAFSVVDRIISSVPVFRYSCAPCESAVNMLEKAVYNY